MDMRKLILIILLAPFITLAQTPQMFLIPKKASAGGGPLSFIQENETAWNTTTSPKTTSSFSVNSGDVLVAFCVKEGYDASLSPNSPTISNTGTSFTWTLQQEVKVGSYAHVLVWTATASTSQSMTVSFTLTQGGYATYYGGNVLQFRNSSGVGATAKTNTTGAPSLSLTTQSNNSMIAAFVGDWNAANGSTRTWRTVNSITPTSGNGLELSYFRDASRYTLYGGYWNDAGAAGSKTVGVSAPSGQKYAIVAVEIKP
jgi:hypothetical protein